MTTQHRIATTEGTLAYTVRTGRVVLGEEVVTDDVYHGWKPKAQLSITAYTLDEAQVTQRPITFLFNGGPGSASIWLHLGLVGPRLVDAGDVGNLKHPPYGLRDNPHTLLRATDLVVIDAMSTGYSRVPEGEKAKDWHGWAKDVEQVSEFIRLWCTREDRWMSPKFLLGESYGTVRAVSVAEQLQSRYGMFLNGIVLVSSVLDFGSQDFENLRWDESCLNFTPSYAAIAWYHGKHPGRSLDQVRSEAEEFCDGPYRLALAKGSRLGGEERAEIADTLARLTGLGVDYIERTNLRIEHQRFCAELLRDQGLNIGRIDGRFTGPAKSALSEEADADPSSSALAGAYTAAMHHYLRSELGSTQDLSYVVSAQLWKDWSYQEFQGRPVNVTDQLESVLRANPACRVRIEFGYYDLATPYRSALDMVDHLKLTDEARGRISRSFFETGHMPYLHEESRIRESEELVAFIRGDR